MTAIDLVFAGQALRCLPQLGAAITEWRVLDQAQPIFVAAPGADPGDSDPSQFGCFPLLPYSNRLEGGVLHTLDGDFRLPRNHPRIELPIHGTGWRASWSVAEHTASYCELFMHHEGAGWPFRFVARQRLELTPRGLEVRLVLTNTDRRAFPAGVGLHPYFPVTPDCLLQLPAQTYWRSAADCLPIARELVPPAWDFRAARRVAGADIDHCFERDTAHPVRIEWPSRAYAVELHCEPIEPFWVVYIPPGAERFCVEPVTHVNNAFALAGRGVAGTGTRQLLPGASLHQRFEFRLIRSGVQL